jgi:hypothetical protein
MMYHTEMKNVAPNGVSKYGGIKLCYLVGGMSSALRAYQRRKGDIDRL